jgi:hypothetical protein
MTLTELMYYTRKIAPFVLLTVIVVFILYYSVQLIILILQLQPKQRIISSNVNMIFGPIPQPIMGVNLRSTEGINFKLETINGVPTVSSASANVYFLPKSPSRFGFRGNIYLMAQSLGINTELTGYELNGEMARFSDAKHRFSVNITNYNFDYEYLNLRNEIQALQDSKIPSEQDIRSKATALLSRLGRYPADLARGQMNIIYLAYNPASGEMTIADDPNNANLVEIDFYRGEVDRLPVSTPRFFNSQNYIVYLFSNSGNDRVVKARVQSYERSSDQVGVYPLISGDEAWAGFSTGKGTVISAPDNITDVVIRRMYLSYFDPDIAQDYFQPIFVFLGDNNFVGYIPAIIPEDLTEATPPAATPTYVPVSDIPVRVTPILPTIENQSEANTPEVIQLPSETPVVDISPEVASTPVVVPTQNVQTYATPTRLPTTEKLKQLQ